MKSIRAARAKRNWPVPAVAAAVVGGLRLRRGPGSGWRCLRRPRLTRRLWWGISASGSAAAAGPARPLRLRLLRRLRCRGGAGLPLPQADLLCLLLRAGARTNSGGTPWVTPGTPPGKTSRRSPFSLVLPSGNQVDGSRSKLPPFRAAGKRRPGAKRADDQNHMSRARHHHVSPSGCPRVQAMPRHARASQRDFRDRQ